MAENEIMHRTELKGVVFWVEKSPEGKYFACSSSGEAVFDQQYSAYCEEDALREMRREIESYEWMLERKRKGQPTPRQLSFLFKEKIPIPLTLTWGEASDLIDERIQEKERKKQHMREYLQAHPHATQYQLARECHMTPNQAIAIRTQIRKESESASEAV